MEKSQGRPPELDQGVENIRGLIGGKKRYEVASMPFEETLTTIRYAGQPPAFRRGIKLEGGTSSEENLGKKRRCQNSKTSRQLTNLNFGENLRDWFASPESHLSKGRPKKDFSNLLYQGKKDKVLVYRRFSTLNHRDVKKPMLA